ncbi:asb017 [Agrotis segetum nucleopolyhedrovirus B]|uniref:Asb017 n=1 Tax=Agrotis segetum nucleopolyhedrovirus B TaxID=1580580 RepID=A0A0A7KV65_9ABAC|nr:asb017 [Agrotis segetum nucleopolyhedrovirus B]AIZ48575.1 asb017 [Agrotis segetum nucleopolyhedrovirus B]
MSSSSSSPFERVFDEERKMCLDSLRSKSLADTLSHLDESEQYRALKHFDAFNMHCQLAAEGSPLGLRIALKHIEDGSDRALLFDTMYELFVQHCDLNEWFDMSKELVGRAYVKYPRNLDRILTNNFSADSTYVLFPDQSEQQRFTVNLMRYPKVLKLIEMLQRYPLSTSEMKCRESATFDKVKCMCAWHNLFFTNAFTLHYACCVQNTFVALVNDLVNAFFYAQHHMPHFKDFLLVKDILSKSDLDKIKYS